jgi:hypothetical protein
MSGVRRSLCSNAAPLITASPSCVPVLSNCSALTVAFVTRPPLPQLTRVCGFSPFGSRQVHNAWNTISIKRKTDMKRVDVATASDGPYEQGKPVLSLVAGGADASTASPSIDADDNLAVTAPSGVSALQENQPVRLLPNCRRRKVLKVCASISTMAVECCCQSEDAHGVCD